MLNLTEMERKLQELPLLPTVVARLMMLSSSDDNFFDEVLKLAEEDPPLALRIIKLSNSAASAPINPITNLQGAIVRIGARQITGLVTSMSVMRVFAPSTQGEKNLWAHAIQVAVASRLIARNSSAKNVDPEQAYLCGLLHDIGRFVLFEDAPEELGKVDETNWTSPRQLVEVENETYGFDHAELGWRVCKKWGLPATVNDVVKNHHIYSLPDNLARNTRLADLIRVIQMADFFSVFMLLNPGALSWETTKLERNLKEQCIHPACSVPPVTAAQLCELASPVIEESSKIEAGLGLRA